MRAFIFGAVIFPDIVAREWRTATRSRDLDAGALPGARA
jgi:hypothetical protein